jgi:NAD(P)-dependent dehydrogenase (short-subunit alcohol dehydrogenase family)
VLVPGDIAEAAHCRAIIDRAVREFGRIDILVNNAAFQRTYGALEDIPDEEWDYTFRTNITAMFHLAKAAVPHMRPGSSIINTTSIQSDKPSSMLLAYASTKALSPTSRRAWRRCWGRRDPGECGRAGSDLDAADSLHHATEKVKSFGEDTPLGRPGQPKELAGIFVLLASEEGSYMTGGIHAVTGGIPLL